MYIVGSHSEPDTNSANRVMVVTFMCMRGHAPRVAHWRETLQTYGLNIWEDFNSGMNQKIPSVKFLVLFPSAFKIMHSSAPNSPRIIIMHLSM